MWLANAVVKAQTGREEGNGPGKVWIGTTNHLALPRPVHAHRPHESQRCQKICAVEYVVDDSLEIVGVVRVLHLSTVGPSQVELVDQLWFPRRGSYPSTNRRRELLEESVVAVSLEVAVRGGDSPRSQVLHDTQVRQGVEIAAHYYGDARHPRDGGLEPDPSLRLSLHDNVVELVGKHECLGELHVCKFWVPGM